MNSLDQKPFFSIAIPTYKREDLLKESVRSCLNQTFGDFEILIANDDPSVKLTSSMFGGDQRIKIINREKNLGMPKNYNTALYEAQGRYFFWLADDDTIMPGFLAAVYQALTENKGLRCVYTAFYVGVEPKDVPAKKEIIVQCFSGCDFLKTFLSRKYQICCFYAVFEIDLIKSMGGLQQVGNTWSPYADMVFPIQAAQAGQIGFVNEPLLFFRFHQGSISSTSTDIDEYKNSQIAYWKKVLPILLSKELIADAAQNIYLLMKWLAADYFEVIRRAGGKKWWQAFQYWSDMEKFDEQIKGYVWSYRLFMLNRFCWLVKHLLKGALKGQLV